MENILKRSRRLYKPVKEIAKQYELSVRQVYKLLKQPEFADCVMKVGNACIRVDVDLFYDTCQKVFR